MIEIFKLNVWRILIAILVLAVLSIYQRIEEVKTVMYIISFYLILVFISATFRIVRGWFIKS